MSESILKEWELRQFAAFRPVRGLIVGLAPSSDCLPECPAFEEFGKNRVRLPCTSRLRSKYGLPDSIYYGSVRVNVLASLDERKATENVLPKNTLKTGPRAKAFLQQAVGSDKLYLAALGDHAKYALIECFDGRYKFDAVSEQTGFFERGNVRFFWATHPSKRAWDMLKCDKNELENRIRVNMAEWAEGFSVEAMPMAAE